MRRRKSAGRNLKILELYREFAETELAMPVVSGEKSESEKFAGASRTYSIEALMGDGRAMQAGTSHNSDRTSRRRSRFNSRDATSRSSMPGRPRGAFRHGSSAA